MSMSLAGTDALWPSRHHEQGCHQYQALSVTSSRLRTGLEVRLPSTGEEPRSVVPTACNGQEYMMQQGGVSKATKTLNLSED